MMFNEDPIVRAQIREMAEHAATQTYQTVDLSDLGLHSPSTRSIASLVDAIPTADLIPTRDELVDGLWVS